MKTYRELNKPRCIIALAIVVFILALCFSPVVRNTTSDALDIFTVATCEAAVEPDFTCDGIDDDIELQEAIDALPATGGEVYVLEGTYTISDTISRAIDNVTIRGIGSSTIFECDGSTPIFDAGVQDGWLFIDFNTDAGGIDISSATNCKIQNVNGEYSFNGQVTINDSGADKDFRIEAVGQANALFVRGSDGNVGFGVADPDTKLEVLHAGTQLKLSFDGTDNVTHAVDTNADYVIKSGSTNLFVTDHTMFNTVIGWGAGTTALGYYNTFIGQNAGFKNTSDGSTTGVYNIYIGSDAGYGYNTTNTGTRNVAIGYRPLFLNQTGHRNVAIGMASMYNNTTGNYNMAIGAYSLNKNTEGNQNVALGFNASYLNQTGNNNVAIGTSALYTNVSGNTNVAIGIAALNSATGSNNLALGYHAGYVISTGENNVFIGSYAGDNTTTGGNNILIGYSLDTPAVGTSNYLSIGNEIYGDLANHYIGIGVADPDTRLEIFNAGTQLKLSYNGTDNCLFMVDDDGKVTITPSGSVMEVIGSFTATSLHAGDGWSGTFTNGDGDTVTVTDGIITDVS